MNVLAKERDIIILLERLLNQSRQDKLMCLNAADKQNLPTYKRFFNQQALTAIKCTMSLVRYFLNMELK